MTHEPPSLAPGMTWPAIGFAARTTVAALVALYIAFLINLDDPKWAPMTVWIVAQSSRGMSLSKGQYRVLGTIAGAVVAVALVALFAQARDLFVLGLALWIGLCAAVATGLRNFRAYGTVLAGYTAAIISLDAVMAPQNVFDIAVSRVSYICLGICTEALFTAIFAPGSPLKDVQARLMAYLRRTVDLSARALRGETNTAAFQRLFSEALALDVSAEYAAASSHSVRNRFGHLRGATAAALAQMAIAQSLREHSASQAGNDDFLIRDATLLLDNASATQNIDPAAVANLQSRIEAALHAETEDKDRSISRLFTLDRLGALLSALLRMKRGQDLFANENARPSRVKFRFHVDHVARLHNGVRAFVAIVAAQYFWIASAWPSGPGFVVILSVLCGLLATRPNPVAAGMGFMKGSIAAVCAAALCNFAILPSITAFAPLAIVLGVFFFATGLALRSARFAAPAASFAFLFLELISPDNASRVNDADFLNGALALLLGVAVAVAAFMLIFPINARTMTGRMGQAIRRDLADIGRAPARWTEEHWISRMADRVSILTTMSPGVTKEQAEADLRAMLAALTIGQAAIALSGVSEHDARLRGPVAAVHRRLASGDLARLAKTSGAAAKHLTHRTRKPASAPNQTVIRAAVLLQDLAEAASAPSLRALP